ncbi:hypothetical protein [Rhodococcus qingshengii]|uniref:hypothetical protein n=1 Tax=Rhodococcus qingshengii TaxID=334542 RepID=UPI0035D90D35
MTSPEQGNTSSRVWSQLPEKIKEIYGYMEHNLAEPYMSLPMYSVTEYSYTIAGINGNPRQTSLGFLYGPYDAPVPAVGTIIDVLETNLLVTSADVQIDHVAAKDSGDRKEHTVSWRNVVVKEQ